ncbi:protein Tob1-like [Apostichopus japonicus]|uniref:protein Tob1-like n=1 Tax=Stichopus japonicus TaxID=307972 RepID=UPI003AB6F9C1
MKAEVQTAVDYIRSHLYNKLPRRRVDVLAEELEQALYEKFVGHWYPGYPNKGSGYRCIRISQQKVDDAVKSAVIRSGLETYEVVENLPGDLCIWIDPGEVSYRISEKGVVTVIYKKEDDESIASSDDLDSPVSEVAPQLPPPPIVIPDSLSTSLQSLHLPTTVVAAPTAPPTGTTSTPATPRPGSLTFTAASFAQTKFGSTKRKDIGKKIDFQQLSPSEFANYMRQRSVMKSYRNHAHVHPQRSPTLSPNAREFVPDTGFNRMPSPTHTSWGIMEQSSLPLGGQFSLGNSLSVPHLGVGYGDNDTWFVPPDTWSVGSSGSDSTFTQNPLITAS